MNVYRSVSSYFCSSLNRKINVGTLIAKYESVRRLVIVFSPGTEAIEYEDASTTNWFDELENNASFFSFVSHANEDSFGNVDTVGGPQGFQGSTGSTGLNGLQGSQGDQGDAGLDGAQGFQGNQGHQGWQGVIGPLWVSVPDTAISSGTPGQIAYDGINFYVCVASNTWRRAIISAW